MFDISDPRFSTRSRIRPQPLWQGRVVAAHGRHFRVEDGAGAQYDCVTRGRKGGVACGDTVMFRPTGAGTAVIEDIVPRRNLLYRSDRLRSKLIAANVDQAFIVLAAYPSPNLELLDRCLMACEASEIDARILVNKNDLPETAALIERLRPYATLGYPVLSVSARADVGPLCDELRERVSIFVGASGVGKSTLVNALVPAARAATQAVSDALDSGRHTTTHTRLYALPGGGALIDSPGMQEFGLRHIAPAQLDRTLPEFRARRGQCRFHNCRHVQEPGCAILAAVEAEEIMPHRWRTYRAVLTENEAPAY